MFCFIKIYGYKLLYFRHIYLVVLLREQRLSTTWLNYFYFHDSVSPLEILVSCKLTMFVYLSLYFRNVPVAIETSSKV